MRRTAAGLERVTVPARALDGAVLLKREASVSAELFQADFGPVERMGYDVGVEGATKRRRVWKAAGEGCRYQARQRLS